MLNQTMLVGRINRIEEKEENTIITLKVDRNYKNEDGLYESDFINCLLKGQIAKSTLNYCKINDVVGIRGHLENLETELFVIAEKVTFLSSKTEN